MGRVRLFGARAEYVVCVNSVPLPLARERTGRVPGAVRWYDASSDVPSFLRAHFDAGMAEGVGWKFAPLRLFPERHEIALDNDCILWALPPSLRAWLEREPSEACLLAEDVRSCFGQFAETAGRNHATAASAACRPTSASSARYARCWKHTPCACAPSSTSKGCKPQRWHVPVRSRSSHSPRSRSRPRFPRISPSPAAAACTSGLNAKRIRWRVGGRAAEDMLREHYARLLPFVRARISHE